MPKQLDAHKCRKTQGNLKTNKKITVDKKIQELVDWSARYPEACVAFGNCPTYILEKYVQSEEELKRLQEQYERMHRYYIYIITRRSQRKINTVTTKCV